MWKKKLLSKKLQYIVIGGILAFATMILSTCISFSNEVYNFIDSEYDDASNANVYIKAIDGTSDLIKEAAKNRTDIDRIETLSGYNLKDCPLYHNKDLLTDLSDNITILVMKDYEASSLSLTPVDGNLKEKGPAKGEVWIQSLFSNVYDIPAGDTFQLGDTTLKVSTIVNDIRKPVSMTNGYSIFINEEDAELFSSLQSIDYVLLTSQTKEETLMTWLDSIYTTEHHATVNDTLSALKVKASLMTLLVSGLGTLSAGLMLILTIVIILFFIRNTILSEYRAIGTYKSVGYSSRQIKGFYLKSYAFVGSIAIIIGALLGLPISYYIGNIALEYVGNYHLSSVSIVTTSCIIVGTFLVVVASVYLALHKISKITPVAALRMGMTNSKAKIKHSLIKNAHSSFAMSINDIWKHKGTSAIIITIITLSFYIAIILTNMLFSFNHMDKNASKWVALPDCDLYVNTTKTYVDDDFLKFMDNSPYVNNYFVGQIATNVVLRNDDSKLNLNYAMISNFDQFDSSLTHVTYQQGRAPKNGKEIAIDDVTLQNTGYVLGDTLEIELEGTKETVMICGIYDSMMAPSVTFHSKAFEDLGVAREKYYNNVVVMLKNPDDIDAFEQSVLDQYPTYTFTTMSGIIDNIKDSIISIMVPIAIILIAVFFTFTLLNIANLITMNNKQLKRDFGIMKAFGFSTGYIIRRNTLRIGILATLGLGISLLIDHLLSGTLFYKTLGVPAYMFNVTGTCLLLAAGLAIIIGLTILLSLSIRRITPKNLMEE
jgi:putative ABC transport system permease protein